MPLCSGLSALIQAATEQLGHLVDTETAASDAASELSHHSYHVDGYASSSDGDLRASTPTRSPNILEDRRKLSFPELLMTLLSDPNISDILTFLPDGKFFAIRTKEFSEDLMIQRFHLKSFEEFLELTKGWGFTRINGNSNASGSIQVFRHPHFKRGAAGSLKNIRFGQNPTEARMSTISDGARIDYSLSDDSQGSSKRRLSPSHVDRDSEDTSQKQQRAKEEAVTSTGGEHDHPPLSLASSINDSEHSKSRRRSSTENRSYALAITASKLDLHCSDDEDVNTNTDTEARPSIARSSVRLIDGAVERATHTIVTNAIETLLFDEGHTRQTYLKHEKELSKSSLPGVIPISQQLFAPPEGTNSAQEPNEEQTTPNTTDESSKENKLIVCPSQLEAAAALMKQAGVNSA
jgi:hypothetical protein